MTERRAKKIAVVLPSLAGGGCERMISYLLPELCSRYQVDLILHQDTVAYPLPENLRKIMLSLDTSARHGVLHKIRRMFSRVRRLRQVFRDNHYELILSCIDMNNVVAFWANRLSGRPAPLIAVEQTVCPEFFQHNPYARRWRRLMLPLLRLVYNRAEGVAVLSESMRDYLRDEVKVTRDMTVIYNGIDADVFRPLAELPGAAAAAEFAALPECFRKAKVRLVNIGRLDGYQKNQERLILLYPRLVEAIPGCELFFIGDGPYLAELQSRANAVQVADKIHFLGWQPAPAPFLRHADCLVHAARYETFGNVLIEALACGTPVVTTDCGAVIPEILENGRLGRILPLEAGEEYVQAVADAMAARHANPESHLQTAELVRRRFAVRQSIDQYLELIATVKPC